MSGDNSDTDPPDPISNSEVKRISGDGSVGFPHVRVAHRQTPNYLVREQKPDTSAYRVFCCVGFGWCLAQCSSVPDTLK